VSDLALLPGGDLAVSWTGTFAESTRVQVYSRGGETRWQVASERAWGFGKLAPDWANGGLLVESRGEAPPGHVRVLRFGPEGHMRDSRDLKGDRFLGSTRDGRFCTLIYGPIGRREAESGELDVLVLGGTWFAQTLRDAQAVVFSDPERGVLLTSALPSLRTEVRYKTPASSWWAFAMSPSGDLVAVETWGDAEENRRRCRIWARTAD
jgi:hypothetical protein